MELMNTSHDRVNSISEILLFYHASGYRTTTPTHGGVITDPEILRHLSQRPVATPLDQVQRYLARLILPAPRGAKYLPARHFMRFPDQSGHPL